jgi:protein-tyrosine-phosphatase
MAEKKAKAEAPKEEPKEQKIDNSGLEELVGQSIDDRMAALLKDHKKMGAR